MPGRRATSAAHLQWLTSCSTCGRHGRQPWSCPRQRSATQQDTGSERAPRQIDCAGCPAIVSPPHPNILHLSPPHPTRLELSMQAAGALNVLPDAAAAATSSSSNSGYPGLEGFSPQWQLLSNSSDWRKRVHVAQRFVQAARVVIHRNRAQARLKKLKALAAKLAGGRDSLLFGGQELQQQVLEGSAEQRPPGMALSDFAVHRPPAWPDTQHTPVDTGLPYADLSALEVQPYRVRVWRGRWIGSDASLSLDGATTRCLGPTQSAHRRPSLNTSCSATSPRTWRLFVCWGSARCPTWTSRCCPARARTARSSRSRVGCCRRRSPAWREWMKCRGGCGACCPVLLPWQQPPSHRRAVPRQRAPRW